MPDLPSISSRKYIQWGDNPPSEPTSTIVLTSPLKSFIDIRLLVPPASSTPREQEIEWAFAGTSHSTPSAFSTPAHTVWKHRIDSTTLNPENIKDEGDMLEQANGDVLEKGSMVNPATGREEGYVECWVDLDLQSQRQGKGGKVGWVLRCEDEEKGVRGMVVRIGDYMQGVLRKGEEFGVRRWKLKDGKWDAEVEIGGVVAPEEFFGGTVEKGKVLKGEDGLEWDCVETFEWS